MQYRAPMRVWQLVVVAVVAGTAVPIALHHHAYGWNVHQAALAFFLWLNVIIALWELCLFARIDRIEREHEGLAAQWRGRELAGVMRFFTTRVAPSKILSPTTWSGIWAHYALFDDSYADRKSFGFAIDVGNGVSTILPCLLVLYGMTYDLVSPRTLGIVGVIACWQMFYGTVVYFFTFVFNRRYRGHSRGNLALFVGLSNGLWMVFPLWGMAVSIALIETGSYALVR
jgi:hypothetical protein